MNMSSWNIEAEQNVCCFAPSRLMNKDINFLKYWKKWGSCVQEQNTYFFQLIKVTSVITPPSTSTVFYVLISIMRMFGNYFAILGVPINIFTCFWMNRKTIVERKLLHRKRTRRKIRMYRVERQSWCQVSRKARPDRAATQDFPLRTNSFAQPCIRCEA